MAAKRKYRWEEWFGAAPIVLIRGIDYHVSQATMAQTIRNNASQRGLRVRVLDEDDTITIEVLGEVPHNDRTAVTS